jgi:hypothetical protein
VTNSFDGIIVKIHMRDLNIIIILSILTLHGKSVVL